LAREALFAEAIGDEYRARETADLVAAALDRLGPQSREILELKTFSGLTFREISEVTGLPQGTVATRYRNGMEKLRVWLVKEMR
jgi:RNA polymerase sigma-70 factor (ECF subfamily)